MKVGQEISLKTLSVEIATTTALVRDTMRARRYGFFKAVFLIAILANIALLPMNVSLDVTQAAAGDAAVAP